MKLRMFGALLLALVCTVILSSCGDLVRSDLVHGISSRSDAMLSIETTLAQLAQLPAEQRVARLKADRPNLEEDVIYYLRRNQRIAAGDKVESVEFSFGSSINARAEDRDGKMHSGYFSNQLLARLNIAGKEPMNVIVTCLNGYSTPIEEYRQFQSMGTFTPTERFTIARGEGLAHHVSFDLSMDLAEQFGLQLYKGRTLDGKNRISVAQARAMEANTDRQQVTVFVREGDTFDLAANTYIPARQ